MKLNLNVPSFKALVKKSHFTKSRDDENEYYEVYAFGVQSVTGKILTFHVMTDSGMMRSRVPISEIYTKTPTKDVPYNYKQLWDCFSENASVTEYEFLANHRAQATLRDGSRVWCTYMFTIDWYDNPYSNEPSDYKCGHVLKSDDGYLVCMPNNRLFWKDSNWVTKPLPQDLKQFKVDTELVSVENQSDRWISEDTDSYYYDMVEESKTKLFSRMDIVGQNGNEGTHYEETWMELEYYEEYQKALTTGMFFEWFPRLTGEWSKDKYAFCHEMRAKRKK